ncbi:MAG: D-glycero-beta-D-manno-heptose 1-phosphate adenylyltransferase, partial [Nocardioidaceae bacterium]
AVRAAVSCASAFVAAGGAGGALRETRADAVAEGDASGLDVVERVRAAGGAVVATGGCFDLLHAGHVRTLEAARRLGDCLVVCLNSDASVRRLKGPGRPLVSQDDRASVLAALGCVDAVVVFDEDTPERALEGLRPHVWAKGGDYHGVELPEARVLGRWGGRAVILPYLEGRSSTRLIEAAGLGG